MFVLEMAIKFARRKHLVNYIGCHITGTIYSGAQIRWITFALELSQEYLVSSHPTETLPESTQLMQIYRNMFEAFLRHILVLGVNGRQVK